MYVKIKSENKFYYYGGQGLVKSTANEEECSPYDMKANDDIVVIRYILSYLFMLHKEAILMPVSKTGERL